MNNPVSRIIVLVLAFLWFGLSDLHAQTFDEYWKQKQAEFGQYKSGREREFKAYRDRINAEFAEYMRQAWPEFQSTPAVPPPDSPEPPKPVVKDPASEPSNDPVPFDEIKPTPKPVEPPQPVVPLPKPDRPVAPGPDMPEPAGPAKPDKPVFTFAFYGQKCGMPLEDKHRFTLKSATENAVADGWKVLSSDEYLPVVAQCLAYRDELYLPDWGYARFVEQMTTAFFPASRRNEARLMQMYILTQSGYKVRLAKVGDRLALLLSSKDTIYGYPCLSIDGVQYYLFEPSAGATSLQVFNREFPKEQAFSLDMTGLPQLPYAATSPRSLRSDHDGGVGAQVTSNKNLIAFFNDYPLSNRWDMYANASLSQQTKELLYPALRNAVAGKSKPVAANILLHFVQTAFAYATDDEQFGYERPLFADETLYYPYSDCEDRAILYSVLVRELLGLDVVLLNYPGHLATAVCFDTDVPGDHLQIDGRRYVVCDPTYINADIGDAMPKFKQTRAMVVKTE